MEARVHGALVDVLLAIVARVPGVGTVAGVQVDTVHTDSAMETWIGLTVVNVDFTIPAAVSWRAGTRVVVDTVLTLASILARPRITFVNIHLTNVP